MSDSEFFVLSFDGWSTFRNESVLRFVVPTLHENLCLRTSTTGSFKITGRHSATDVSVIIRRVLMERACNRNTNYYVSYSVSFTKADVRKFVGIGGDDYWFPSGVFSNSRCMRR